MKIYTVGGYVRDMLLRQSGVDVPTAGDRDWVVVGATPEELLAKGFKPVGNDFPVFLHPKTHEEYALARTERKTAPGYHGFIFHASPDVTLEEDLRRRDLTINAIAMADDGSICDPFGGQTDLKNRVLRHVSEAFEEDPVRILRVARFAAKFGTFTIAPETMALMRKMVQNGEADALVPERIWAELVKGFKAPAPLRMIETLIECDLWSKIFPEVPEPDDELRQALTRFADHGEAVGSCLALLTVRLGGSQAAAAASRLRAPASVQQLCRAFSDLQSSFAKTDTPEGICQLFERGDAVRRPERMTEMLRMWSLLSGTDTSPLERLQKAWCNIDAGIIASQQSSPRAIPGAIRTARCQAVLAAAKVKENEPRS